MLHATLKLYSTIVERMNPFQNTPVNRFQPVDQDPEKVTEDFDKIDGLFDSVMAYIFTEIWMSDHTESLEVAFRSRLKILMSNHLFRVLLLKDGIVHSLNNANFPTYYAALKSFMEVTAVFGYLSDKISRSNDLEELIQVILKIHLGNRDSGVFPRGHVDSINVMTMLSASDRKFTECVEDVSIENPLTDCYSDVCNFGHPNFNAHLSTGRLVPDTSVWSMRDDNETYKLNLYDYYMHGFTISTAALELFVRQIFNDQKVNGFAGTTGHPLF